MESTTIGAAGPRSFLFYVVADVGLPGHRPLAVTYRQGHGPGPGRDHLNRQQRVYQVVRDTARIIGILTDPANRVALEAELAMAFAWYRGGQQQHHPEPERVEIPDDPSQPNFEFAHLKRTWAPKPNTPSRPELPWAEGIREFPFISTCLRLGLRPDAAYSIRVDDVQEQPLSTVFRGDKLEYGMVVFDISNLDSVRYGIVGFKISYVAEIYVETWCPVEGRKPDKAPVLQLEKSRSRQPLSASGYMSKFGLYNGTKSSERLKKQRVVGREAVSYIWLHDRESSHGRLKAGLANEISPITRDNALDQAVIRLIQNAKINDRLDVRTYHDYTNDPEFQARLLAYLRQDPGSLGGWGSSAQLLQLAYAGHSHLNWVPYSALTYDTIASAIESAELRGATALSICVDNLDNGLATPLLEALARQEGIRDLCLFEGPARANDDKTSRLFSAICSSPHPSTLLAKNIYLTCAFSASLRRRFWLPFPGADLGLSHASMTHAFPVQHMFVRQQFVDGDGDEKRFRPCHFFLGDALLKPERVVTGLFQYCLSVLSDPCLFSFAAVHSTVSSEFDGLPGTAVSPIPAENFALPERCSISPATVKARGPETREVECWPMFRGLEPGTWVLLVSHEWRTGDETRRQRAELLSQGLSGDSAIGVPHVRYAFLRARERISWRDIIEGPGLDALVGPECFDIVAGAREYLRATAPDVDGNLVDARFEDTVRALQERWPRELGPDPVSISVLDNAAARSILREFLEDTIHIRENLATAMQAMPGDQAWYPELLFEKSRYNLRG